MFNIISLIGNLGQDPEVRYAASGTAICNLSIAVSEFTKDASGQPEKKTHWFRCVCFGRTAEIAGQYLKKGSKAGISGSLVTRQWEDSQGNKRESVEIRVNQLELLTPKSDSGQQYQPQHHKPSDDPDEDIPF